MCKQEAKGCNRGREGGLTGKGWSFSSKSMRGAFSNTTGQIVTKHVEGREN